VLGAEPLHRLAESIANSAPVVPPCAELGGEEQVPAVDAAAADALPHGGFIGVVLGRVDVPVAVADGLGTPSRQRPHRSGVKFPFNSRNSISRAVAPVSCILDSVSRSFDDPGWRS
jgi:hypothetical protein